MDNHNLEIIGRFFLYIILDKLLYVGVSYRAGRLQYKCSGGTELAFCPGLQCLRLCQISLDTHIWVIELYSGKERKLKQIGLPFICFEILSLPRKVCSGGLFFFSQRNLKVTSTILLFGSIQNVVRTIEYRKFCKQQKISFGGGSGSLDTSSKADWTVLRRLFIVLINIEEVLFIKSGLIDTKVSLIITKVHI